ncbi:protein associated with UVRAG as autophagy enhancer isoform 2-T5 [Spinachia spinachia]
MESCEGASLSLHRSKYISRCVDSATVTPEEHLRHSRQPADPGSVPLLLLTPPETDAAFSHQRPRAALRDRTGGGEEDDDDDDDEYDEDGEGGTQWSKEEMEARNVILPRSSPVISRRHRPVSWHGEDTGMPAPSRHVTCSSLDSPSPALVSPSPHQCGGPTVRSPSAGRRAKKPLCPPASSQLNRLLGPWARRPSAARQGHEGRGPTGCGASDSSGHSKERTCNGLPEVSADIFKTSCDLEKENAHFVVVDIILEVLEGVKWTLSGDRQTSRTDTRQGSHGNTCAPRDAAPQGRRPRCEASRRTRTCSAGQDEAETFSILSSVSGIKECGVDSTPTATESLTNAESLAHELVLEFRKSWLPSCEPRRGRQSLCSSLQELPDTAGVAVSSLAQEIRLRTRMRGSQSWAPPRFQIIFTVQPTNRRSDVVALQHFLCAGCGTEVEPRYIKKLRYCEYLGRYFCECCHSGSEAVIPGRLLSCWDFRRYPVSDFSKQLLNSVWNQPLFDLTRVGKTLYSKVKELDKFRELRKHLMGLKKLLSTCRLSGRATAELERLPAHLMEQPLLFSMEDLSRVKKGQLVARTRALLLTAIDHVQSCEVSPKHFVSGSRVYLRVLQRKRRHLSFSGGHMYAMSCVQGVLPQTLLCATEVSEMCKDPITEKTSIGNHEGTSSHKPLCGVSCIT